MLDKLRLVEEKYLELHKDLDYVYIEVIVIYMRKLLMMLQEIH